ncbi:MAG: phenylalanine--tRNA ligase subunit alpha [Hyphomicrobiales bacterium]|nr:phenylalanine--tRNA ligase subunit alpha [Hyphomicrobiales bacterium]
MDAVATASKADLTKLEKQLLGEIEKAGNLATLEDLRVGTLGKSGSVTALLKTLGKLPADERRETGQAINALKGRVSEALEARKDVLQDEALARRLETERADITLPVYPGPQAEGRIHPLSQVWDEITAIFADLGFAVAEGPDIETDDYNFTKLNIPQEHPARQEHDTFYMKEKADGSRLVLRTHTSPVQIRTMLSQKPPIRIVAPGRVYRSDSDQTHTPMFHQIEALVIDEDTHMGHLKWLISEFCKAFFELDELRVRLRISHFPFTEPSMEVDIGAEAIGKPGEWLEIGGSGMVHPNVIRACNLDPDRYQGFAFGFGIDRMAMLKYGIPDLRAFFGADLRWLKHYGFLPFDVPTLAGGLSS